MPRMTLRQKLRVVQGGFFLLALLTFFLFGGLFQRFIDQRIEDVRSEFIDNLEEKWGYRVRYKGIAPSIFNFFEIKDLVIFDRQDPAREILRIERLRLYYNPLSLLFGKDGKNKLLRAIKKVVLIRPRGEIDSERDKILFSQFASEDGTASQREPFPIIDTTSFQIKDLNFRIRIKEQEIRVAHLSLSLNRDQDHYETRGQGSLWLGWKTPLGEERSTSGNLLIRGNIDYRLDSFNLTTKVESLHFDPFVLKEMTILVSFQGGRLAARKIKDRIPLDFHVSYNFHTDFWESSFEAENFRPHHAIQLTPSSKEDEGWVAKPFTGRGSLEGKLKEGVWSYGVRLVNGSDENEDSAYRFSLLFEGDENLAHVSEFEVIQEAGGVASFAGDIRLSDYFPSGMVLLRNIRVGKGEQVVGGKILLERVGDRLLVDANAATLGKLSPRKATLLVLSNEDSSYSFSLYLDLAKGEDLPSQEIFWDGEIRGEMPLYSTFRGEKLSLERLLQIHPIMSSASALLLREGDIQADFRGVLQKSAEKEAGYQLFLEHFALVSQGDQEQKIIASAWIDRNTWALRNLHIISNEMQLVADLGIYREGTVVTLRSYLNINGFPYHFSGRTDEAGMFHFTGPYSTTGKITAHHQGEWNSTWRVQDLPLPLVNGTLFLGVEIMGERQQENWVLSFREISVRYLSQQGSEEMEMILSGRIDEGGLTITSLTYQDLYSSLRGFGGLRLGARPEQEFYGWVEVIGARGEKMKGNFAYGKKGTFAVSSSIARFPLQRVLGRHHRGFLSGKANFRGTLASPEGRATIQVEGGGYRGNPYTFELDIVARGRTIGVPHFSFEGSDLILSNGFVFLGLEKGHLSGTIEYATIINADRAEGTVTLVGEADRPLALQDFARWREFPWRGSFRFSEMEWNGAKAFPSFTTRFSHKEGEIRAKIDGGLAEGKVNLSTGEIEVHSRKILPIRGSFLGRISKRRIDGRTSGLVVDLPIINYFMYKDPILEERHVLFQKGTIEGDLLVKGSLASPQIEGVLIAKDLVVETPYSPRAVALPDYHFPIHGGEIHIESLLVPIEGGVIGVNGLIGMDGLLPATYRLDFRLEGDPGIPITYSAYGYGVEGNVNGTLSLWGNEADGAIKGEILLNDLLIELNERKVLRDEKKNPYGFIVTLHVTIGKNASLYIPNRDIRVVHAVLEPQDRINIFFDKARSNLDLRGMLSLRSGDIRYLNRGFRLIEGNVTLAETLDRFNPFLSFRGETRTRDQQGDDVRLYLVYSGYVLDEFNPRVESQPVKSQAEVMALLGQTSQPAYGGEGVTPLLIGAGGMVGRSRLIDSIEKAVKNVFRLDTIYFRTGLFENLLISRVSGRAPLSEQLGNDGIERYLDNTQFTVGKYLGDVVYLEGSLSADYQFDSGLQKQGQLLLDTEVSLHFNTPFFSLQWNTDLMDIKRLFIAGSSIGITWRFPRQ